MTRPICTSPPSCPLYPSNILFTYTLDRCHTRERRKKLFQPCEEDCVCAKASQPLFTANFFLMSSSLHFTVLLATRTTQAFLCGSTLSTPCSLQPAACGRAGSCDTNRNSRRCGEIAHMDQLSRTPETSRAGNPGNICWASGEWAQKREACSQYKTRLAERCTT